MQLPHCAIKCQVDKDWNAKVTDFNLSRVLDEARNTSSAAAMNPRCGRHRGGRLVTAWLACVWRNNTGVAIEQGGGTQKHCAPWCHCRWLAPELMRGGSATRASGEVPGSLPRHA